MLCLTLWVTTAYAQSATGSKEMYELRIYELKGGGSLAPFDKYLSQALIPALNRHGIKNVGVFKESGKTEPPKVYVLIPYASATAYTEVRDKLIADEQYKKASEEYNNLPAERPVIDRFDTYLMFAFDGMPKVKIPEKGQRIFELRIYEGYNEDAVRRKVKMFNDGEFEIFARTKLTPVFFGELIAGKELPALAYMLTFKDMAERDANWKTFLDDPKWIEMRDSKEYANTVSRIVRIFLEPASYSQI